MSSTQPAFTKGLFVHSRAHVWALFLLLGSCWCCEQRDVESSIDVPEGISATVNSEAADEGAIDVRSTVGIYRYSPLVPKKLSSMFTLDWDAWTFDRSKGVNSDANVSRESSESVEEVVRSWLENWWDCDTCKWEISVVRKGEVDSYECSIAQLVEGLATDGFGGVTVRHGAVQSGGGLFFDYHRVEGASRRIEVTAKEAATKLLSIGAVEGDGEDVKRRMMRDDEVAERVKLRYVMKASELHGNEYMYFPAWWIKGGLLVGVDAQDGAVVSWD